MAAVPGFSIPELNYPQHRVELGEGELDALLAETGPPLTVLNLRSGGARFARGARTAPDDETREDALQIAVKAAEIAAQFGARHVIHWMAADGWDHPFQANDGSIWDAEIDGFRAVADHHPSVHVMVEYKPYGPRRFSLIRSMVDALLAVRNANRPNLGVTLDVCHNYMAGEHPPAATATAPCEGKLFGIHLSDGDGTADDGLMLASVHERDALELLYVLRAGHYEGPVYFDTFPIHEDPAGELAANIAELERLEMALDRLDQQALRAARNARDAISVARVVSQT